MDILLILIGFIFVCLGLAGSFLPIIPGPLTGWVGLFILYLSESIPSNWTFLGITLTIALLVFLLDYIIPSIGTKKFGGTKYGIIGTSLGLIFGILTPIPFGIIIGPFIGAFIGEMINDNTNQKGEKFKQRPDITACFPLIQEVSELGAEQIHTKIREAKDRGDSEGPGMLVC